MKHIARALGDAVRQLQKASDTARLDAERQHQDEPRFVPRLGDTSRGQTRRRLLKQLANRQLIGGECVHSTSARRAA